MKEREKMIWMKGERWKERLKWMKCEKNELYEWKMKAMNDMNELWSVKGKVEGKERMKYEMERTERMIGMKGWTDVLLRVVEC